MKIYVRSGFEEVGMGNKQEKFFPKLLRHENINCRKSQRKNDGINLQSPQNIKKKKKDDNQKRVEKCQIII